MGGDCGGGCGGGVGINCVGKGKVRRLRVVITSKVVFYLWYV